MDTDRTDDPGATTDFGVSPGAPSPSPGAPSSSQGLSPGGPATGWLAHYRVLGELGSGGMGVVYLAEDTQLGREVAVKVVRPELAALPEAAARFAREARAAASIRHDHVVTIYHVGEHGGVPYLVMERLEGISLQRWLERGRKPSLDLVLRIGREVASGLAAAHALGLVHRDVKPANIWLEAPRGRVKLLDFGQARSGPEDVEVVTSPGAIVGTPLYMSPEQATGAATGPPSDLFSLGCLLYRLCCGHPPFEGATVLAVLNALASRDPVPPRELDGEIPAELEDLILRLLAKAPEARPADAQVVVEDLRAIERGRAGRPHEVKSAAGAQFPSRRGRRRLWWLAAAPAIAALLLAARWLPTSRRRVAAPTPDPVVSPRKFDLGPLAASSPPRPADPAPPVREPEVQEGQKDAGLQASEEGRADADDAKGGAARAPAPPRSAAAGTPPGTSAVAPPRPAAADPEATWGILVDPDEDCRLVLDDARGTARLDVPGRAHLLSAELRRMNAPRTRRPVAGDFRARVHALGTGEVAGRPTAKEFPPYHGAGLVLWQDEGNYVRLEIATDVVRGKPRHYANFEYRGTGRLVASKGLAAEDGSAYLRLSRAGQEVTAAFSHDGERWVTFPSLVVALDERLELGLLGVNSASRPLAAEFREFEVRARGTADPPDRP